MSKLFVGVIVIALIIAGWIMFTDNTIDYVSSVDSQLFELEQELASLDAAVAAGTLTPEEAETARTKIMTHLAAIDTQITSAESASLTPLQRAMLADALARLKATLITYRATLDVVENTADQSPVAKLKQGSGSKKTIAEVITETIEVVEEHVEDVVEDYVSEEVVEDDTATSTDEISDETASTSDESDETVDDDESTEGSAETDDNVEPEDDTATSTTTN